MSHWPLGLSSAVSETMAVVLEREIAWSTLDERITAESKAARIGESGASLLRRGNEIEAGKKSLGAEGRMCDVVNRPCARVKARLPLFEARRGCF